MNQTQFKEKLETQRVEELDKKIIGLEIANKKLENYSKDLEETVQKRTLELLQINSKLNAIIENCADGIILFDHDLKITDLNSDSIDLFGQNKEDLLSKNLFELVVSETKLSFLFLKNNTIHSISLNKCHSTYILYLSFKNPRLSLIGQ